MRILFPVGNPSRKSMVRWKMLSMPDMKKHTSMPVTIRPSLRCCCRTAERSPSVRILVTVTAACWISSVSIQPIMILCLCCVKQQEVCRHRRMCSSRTRRICPHPKPPMCSSRTRLRIRSVIPFIWITSRLKSQIFVIFMSSCVTHRCFIRFPVLKTATTSHSCLPRTNAILLLFPASRSRNRLLLSRPTTSALRMMPSAPAHLVKNLTETLRLSAC